MQFSEKIIAARRGMGMSQETLAEAVGVSRQAVSKWETGEAKPDLDKLIGLCTALDLNMGYLCLDKEPAPPPAPEKIGCTR
jgi:transcriptional regulator with XRE-family HTH domain